MARQKTGKPQARRPKAAKPAAPREVIAEVEQRVRLNALLARSGFGARRKCEEFITDGRVMVDGKTVTELGTVVDPARQKVLVDGEPLRPQRTVVYMVNKPKGMLCTHADPQGRPRVVDLFPHQEGRIFPIGRLDENSVGLLLVTNDGELGHKLAHPRFRVAKTYHVHVAGRPEQSTLDELRKGIYFAEGKFQVDGVRKLKVQGQSTILEIVLHEGQNREIRRLMARVGHKVMRLERVGFGPLKLSGVAPGSYRLLTREEMHRLTEYVARYRERVAVDQKERTEKREAAKQRRVERPAGPAPETIEISPVARRVGSRDLTGLRRDGFGMTSEAPFQPQLSPQELARAREVRVTKLRSPLLEVAIDEDDSDRRRGRHPAAVGRRPNAPRPGAGGKPAAKRTGAGKSHAKAGRRPPKTGKPGGGRSRRHSGR